VIDSHLHPLKLEGWGYMVGSPASRPVVFHYIIQRFISFSNHMVRFAVPYIFTKMKKLKTFFQKWLVFFTEKQPKN